MVSKKILMAVKVAKRQAHKSRHLYKIGAVCLRNRKIVGYGFNKSKIHGNLFRNYGFWSIHGECDCLLGTTGADTIVVVRVSKKGGLTCAKPCDRCMKYMRDYGISRIYFSDWNSEIVKLEL